MGNVEVGQAAPDFGLPAIRVIDGEVHHFDLRLSEHRGRPLVLVFYPFDASVTCTKQLCEYQAEFDGFENLGADVWGISLQDIDSHVDFALAKNLSFPLLSDSRGDGVAAAYGATMLGELVVRRSVFIIDAEGLLRWKHVAHLGLFGYRAASELREKLLELFPEPSGDAFTLPPPVAAPEQALYSA
jgi:peroxiredoxin Q/BCP